MKRLMKKILLSVFSAVFAVVLGIGVFSSLSVTEKASAAETETWQTGLFEMEDGVSLKLSEKSGLRFIVKMDETVYSFLQANEDAELGFIMAPESLMIAADGDYINMPKKIGGSADKEMIYQDGEFYYANGCITRLNPINFSQDFVAVAYIKSGEEIRYTEYNTYARNNLYDVVNMAVLHGYADEVFELETYTGSDDLTDDNTGWYGSKDFPMFVENSDEYDAIINIVNEDGIDLSPFRLAVYNNAEPTRSFAVSEYKPTIISGALDTVNKLIEGLPNEITMPDAIGVIARIKDAEEQYNALSDADKAKVEGYEKVESLLEDAVGYNRVYRNDAYDNTVIPSYVPNYTSTIGGIATQRTDPVYGNVLTVTSKANGKAALHYENFPIVNKYTKIYFYVKVSVGCDIYLSDGIINDGWGDNWHNTWSETGYWCNANTWRLVEIDTSTGYIGADNFALGFRTNTTGFTFEISDFYGVPRPETTTGLTFGNFTNSGTTNEHGVVYNFTQGWASETDMGAFNQNALQNALVAGDDRLHFWIYNPNESAVDFRFAGDMNGWNAQGEQLTTLAAKAWTEVVITPETIEMGNDGTWFVSVTSGAGTAGWQISAISSYNLHTDTSVYVDQGDVKDVIAAIDAIPGTLTMADKTKVEKARAAYDALSVPQKQMISNFSDLVAAEAEVADLLVANEVVVLIDEINPRAVDEMLVANARLQYDALTENQQRYVTNLSVLEAYEADINAANELAQKVNAVKAMIANLPDSVVMPDHLVFVPRIEAARDAYTALTAEERGMVDNYSKLKNLVTAIKGYSTVHVQTLEGANVVPSHVPNYTSTIGGTASLGSDAYYGNYLKVTPDAGGKAAVQFVNFPSVSAYTKIFFNIRVVGASCDIYLSDGITNDGWGDNWKNTWSMSGFWANDGSWIQKEVDVTSGIFSSNWALGLRTNTTDVSFEITDIIGYAPVLGNKTTLTFGNFTDSGTTNAYGTVYNFTQGWSSATDMGAFNQNVLNGTLVEGDDMLHFWIYNPNESAVDFKFTGDMNSWNPQGDYVTNLAAKAWTEVVITPTIIAQGNSGQWFVTVSEGAGTAGWQISPIYSISTAQDDIDKVQQRINALNSETPDEYQVGLARTEYEKLSESEKQLINASNLIACETKLYGDVANAPFIVAGETPYKIYADVTNANMTESILVATSFLNEHLQDATQVSALPVVTNDPSATLTKYRYAIVFGYADLFEQVSGKSMADIADGGYYVVKVGRTVFIEATSADGYRMAMFAFLREVVGYDMLSEDCILYNGDASVLPELDINEAPSFEYRQKQTALSADEVYGMGLSSNTDLWIPSEKGWDMHNTLHYLPTETYRSAHPSWYYDYTDSIDVARTQICPTAGGSSAEFAAMVQTIADRMMLRINEFPGVENISFSIMDTGDNDDCSCARCQLYDTLYGEGGFAAAWIDLMNAVNAKLREQLGDRKINIAFLAYRGTEKAPANDDFSLKQRYVINDDGTYQLQTDENGNPVYLKCDEGVAVWLAPINAVFAENLNHPDNAAHLATVKKWAALSDSVYMWLYGTNFKFYMYPYNSWQASAENYKILADLGVKAAWSQSNETEATAFTDLKAYIDSKFMLNADSDYETVLNTYFTNYYGPAATAMRSMFDAIVTRCNEIEEDYDGLGRGIYDELENTSGFIGIGAKTYWSKDWLEDLLALIDEAYAAIAAYETSDPALYAKLQNRIKKESLFPRYVLCTTFASKYTSSKKKEMRQAFKADCDALGLTLYREADGLLTDLYSDWGI